MTDDDVVQVPGQLLLFPEPALQLPGTPPPAPRTSADRRRTQRQRERVARGIHPLTGGRTFPSAGTCGDCPNRRPQDGERSWPKCGLWPVTGGPATDCRAWWPACARHPNVQTGAQA